jgi:hypothetical protein
MNPWVWYRKMMEVIVLVLGVTKRTIMSKTRMVVMRVNSIADRIPDLASGMTIR